MRRLALLALIVLPLAAPTAATATTPGARITNIDTTGYPTIRVSVVTGAVQTQPPILAEGGTRAPGQVAINAGTAKSLVLAVDRSRSMRGASLDSAVAAARAFVAAKPQRDRVAVVTFGERAARLTRFSSATIDADLALRTLGVDGRAGTALYDAVVLAALSLAVEPLRARQLVLVTDGTDVSSDAGLEEAVQAARRAHVAVHAIGIEGSQFSPAPLRELARRTGGSYHGASSAAALGAVYRQVGDALRRSWQIEYKTRARPGDDVRLTVGSAQVTLAVPGTPAAKPPQPTTLVPRAAFDQAWGPFLFGGAAGLLLLAALAFVAGARRGKRLRTRLEAHVDARAGARRRGQAGLSAAATLMRVTERAFGAMGIWQRVQRLLERADMPLKTVEFVYVCAGSALVLTLFTSFLVSSPLALLVGFAAGAFLPVGIARFKATRRGRKFEDQLPDILLTIAGSLKAGHSFKQGLQTVADESEEPAAKEFQRVLAEMRLGRQVEGALTEVAERVSSKNLAFVVTAVTIQSQVGGSLAGLFDMVADAVRNRQQFARKVRGLTAMGRASAYVLLGLPFALVGMIMLVQPGYMSPLYDTPTGRMLIALGLTMMAIGTVVLRKIVSFKG